MLLKNISVLLYFSVEEPLGQHFSNLSVSAVPFLGVLWKCRPWFSRPGVGPWVCISNKFSGDAHSARQGEPFFYSTSPSCSKWAERLENMTSQPGQGVWFRGQLEHQRQWGSKLGSVFRCVYWATVVFWSFTCKMEAWVFFERVEWHNGITCNVLSQAHSKYSVNLIIVDINERALMEDHLAAWVFASLFMRQAVWRTGKGAGLVQSAVSPHCCRRGSRTFSWVSVYTSTQWKGWTHSFLVWTS